MNKFGKIFITGATGFIGGHLAKRLLLEEGAPVRALARDMGKAQWLVDMGAEIIQGDITQPETWADSLQGCQVVYHSAGWVGESGAKEQVWAVNVDGAQNIVDAAVAAEVKRFIHISTCGVYGSLQADNIDENTPVRLSGNVYKDSKIFAEEVVFNAYREHGLPIVVARASQVYGPGSKHYTIRPIEVIRSRKMFLIDGGRHMFKPIYIDNLVNGLVLCAKMESAIGEAINLTDGEPVSWRDYFGAYGQMVGVESFPSLPYPIAWLVALLYETRAKINGRNAGVTRETVNSLRSSNSFSNQKARQLLGWAPLISLEEGITCSENWLREQGYLDGVGTGQ